jgi:hypothetical protein
MDDPIPHPDPCQEESVDRRKFLLAAGGVLGGSAFAMAAKSYARVIGANDRIRIAQLGCGSRSHGHVTMVRRAAKRTPAEVVAVCDIWSIAREKRAAQVGMLFDNKPKVYKYSEEMLANHDIDGVMIATGDHQHAKLCIEVVQAGKDCYVEKPFANVLEEAKAARDTVKRSKQVVQVGTQHRSQAYPLAVRDIIRSGRIGKIARISQEWNTNQPRWRHIPKYDDGKMIHIVVVGSEKIGLRSVGNTNNLRCVVEPNATVDHGFSHSLACIMAAQSHELVQRDANSQSYWSGKRLYWNPKTEQILDTPV